MFIVTSEPPAPAQASAHSVGSKDCGVMSASHERAPRAPGSSPATSVTHSTRGDTVRGGAACWLTEQGGPSVPDACRGGDPAPAAEHRGGEGARSLRQEHEPCPAARREHPNSWGGPGTHRGAEPRGRVGRAGQQHGGIGFGRVVGVGAASSAGQRAARRFRPPQRRRGRAVCGYQGSAGRPRTSSASTRGRRLYSGAGVPPRPLPPQREPFPPRRSVRRP